VFTPWSKEYQCRR